MAGMETCVVNLIEPGDKMVVCVNGVFGQRMTDVAQRAGAVVTVLERPWGEVFDLDQIREMLQKVRPKVLGIVHAETSTGAWQPLDELGKLCHEFDALLLVDTVTSLGGVPVELDAWGIDAVYSGTQKCLSCPPGLSPVSFSPRAVEAINRRKTKVQSWYLDMTHGPALLGRGALLSPHRADHDDLRPARGAAAGHEEGLEARWAAAPAQPPGASRPAWRRWASPTPRPRAISCRSSTRCASRRAWTTWRCASGCWRSSASRSAAAWATSRARSGASA